MNLNITLRDICNVYKKILQEDGEVEKGELIKMLKADYDIPVAYQTEEYYKAMADYILKKSKRQEMDERRMKLYEQGLTKEEIAKKEGVCLFSIDYWFKTRGLKKKPIRCN